jgi:hypothetical protein
MTDQSPSDTDKVTPPKKTVSPARNAVGLVALVVVLIVGGIQLSSMAAFRSAVNKLNERMEDDNKELLTQAEAEAIIGKTPDDGGTDTVEAGRVYSVKNYTWKGLLKSYTLAAYYSKEQPNARLYRIEPEGQKLEQEPVPAQSEPPVARKGGGMPPVRGGGGGTAKKGGRSGSSKKKGEAKGDQKPDEKAKAGTDEKAKVGTDEKPKAGADENPKADTPPPPGASDSKADDKSKAGADAKDDPPAKSD